MTSVLLLLAIMMMMMIEEQEEKKMMVVLVFTSLPLSSLVFLPSFLCCLPDTSRICCVD